MGPQVAPAKVWTQSGSGYSEIPGRVWTPDRSTARAATLACNRPVRGDLHLKTYHQFRYDQEK
jgi:hypothetical protein